jgi:riboflavin synthase
MFTGIVEQMGTVAGLSDTPDGKRLTISGAGLGDLPIGASIAVNGVCLTAVDTGTDRVVVDVIPETLKRTNLGAVDLNTSVNLERPMPANGRFDGHIVQGHVDGVGRVAAIEAADGGVSMTVEVAEELRRYLVEKGSVTIDGVSLTVAGLTGNGFTVALIPHTLEVTTLGLRQEGDEVNLEMDVLAKYVERLLGK